MWMPGAAGRQSEPLVMMTLSSGYENNVLWYMKIFVFRKKIAHLIFTKLAKFYIMYVNETYRAESASKADAFHPILILITYIDGEL